ncbi:MAG TPA: hypothetical protein VFI90_11260 [Rubrobacter sp.]|nr:hypothetical protein [Rubrobacter sp.]
MLRSAIGKVMWVGKATVFLVGLSVIIAVVLGVATMALAANGGAWRLGRNNVATAITRLGGVAGVDGPMLRLTNNNAATNDTAVDLVVQNGEPPMTVNSSARVANLNADQLDGKDEGQFATRLHALIKGSDGSLVRGNGVTAQFKTASPSAGGYEVLFDRDVRPCVYIATIASENAGRGGDGPAGEIGVRPLSTNANGVAVSTFNSSGTLANSSFSLTVFC